MALSIGFSRKPAAAILLVAMVTLVWSVSPVSAATYYVSPTGSSGNPGTAGAPWSLSHANAALNPGDTAILLDGTYTTGIAPARSGTAGNEITYRAQNSRQAELTLSNPRLMLDNRHYITVDGIKAHDGYRYAIGNYGSHLTINDCDFSFFFKSSFETGRFRNTGGYITVTNSHIREGNDSLHIREGRGHYIAGNTFYDGGHTILILMGVTNSVVENNSIINTLTDANGEKCMEVFSIRQALPPNEIKSEYNLIQNNYFRSDTSSGIQYAGNSSIIRRNIFDSSVRAMNFANYGFGPTPEKRADDPEAYWDEHNRFYNNSIYKCNTAFDCKPLSRTWSQGGAYGDNIAINNILSGGGSNLILVGWDGKPEHIFLFNNAILRSTPDQLIYYYSDGPESHTVASLEAAHPDNYADNLTIPAQFVNAPGDDFTLQATSECIDAAGPLTRTTASGSGMVVSVVDALYFTDGYGVVAGDMIRVEDQLAQVVSVDYSTNVVTVDRFLNWGPNAPVYTDYKGIAPDLGAFEADAVPAVAGEHIFYNNSAWDGNEPAANGNDDSAIANNKHSLRPDDRATFANYTSYSKGINGIMVDMMASAEPLLREDFSFKVGNDSDPDSWAPAPEPRSITIREGAGISGSDRVTIIWADNAIQNQWLQVTVLASPQSGLDEPYIFSFGNAIGETGDSASDAQVTAVDELEVRDTATTPTVNSASIQRATDFNRDKKVGPTDAIICRNNASNSSTALQLVVAPSVAINQAPTADAGNTGAGVPLSNVTISGSVLDDGYPIPPGQISVIWSVDSAPTGALVTIDDPNALETKATFSLVGTYVMQLEVTDGDLSDTDTVEVVIEEPVSGIFFEDDFDDGNIDGWTLLGTSDFEVFQLLSEPGYEVRALLHNSRMRANLDSTALSDTVYMSCQIRHTGALGGGGGWKGGWMFFVDDSGEGFGAYFGLEQSGNGGVSFYITTDDAATSTYLLTLIPFDPPGPAAGWDYKNIQIVFNRLTGRLDYYYEGILKGTISFGPNYRDFTRVIVQLVNAYDGNYGQIDIDNIRIADTPTWPIALP